MASGLNDGYRRETNTCGNVSNYPPSVDTAKANRYHTSKGVTSDEVRNYVMRGFPDNIRHLHLGRYTERDPDCWRCVVRILRIAEQSNLRARK